MRRALLLTALLAAGGAAAWHFSRSTPEASAETSVAQVIGTYKLKLKGEGWLRGTATPYQLDRFAGGAVMVLTRGQPDDGRVHVEIRVAPELNGGLLDLATLKPDFSGDGRIVEDSIAVIGTGASTYVNALTLTFQKDGAKCFGHWSVFWPAADADAGPAGAVDVALTGRRVPPPKGAGGKRFEDR